MSEAEKSSKYIKENYTVPEINVNLKDLDKLEICFILVNVGIKPETTLTEKMLFTFLKELENKKEGNLKTDLKKWMNFLIKNLSLD